MYLKTGSTTEWIDEKVSDAKDTELEKRMEDLQIKAKTIMNKIVKAEKKIGKLVESQKGLETLRLELKAVWAEFDKLVQENY